MNQAAIEVGRFREDVYRQEQDATKAQQRLTSSWHWEVVEVVGNWEVVLSGHKTTCQDETGPVYEQERAAEKELVVVSALRIVEEIEFPKTQLPIGNKSDIKLDWVVG